MPAPLSRTDLLRLVAEESCRDGILEEREKRLLEVLVDFLRIDRPTALAIVEESRRRHREGLLGPPRALDERTLYRAVLDAVHADGQLDRVEAKMLEAVRRLLDITPAVHRELFDELGLLDRTAARVPAPEPVPAPAAPAPPPPAPAADLSGELVSEVRALFEETASLPASQLGLPASQPAEEKLRARCLAVQRQLSAQELEPVDALRVHGALFRVMASLGCAIAETRGAGERARAAHDHFTDCIADGDPVQRLIAQAWLARAANLSEAGMADRARTSIADLARHLDDRKVLYDLKQSGTALSPPRKELTTSTAQSTVALGAMGTAALLILTGGTASWVAASAFLAAGMGLMAADGATVRFDDRRVTLTTRVGEKSIAWSGLATVAFGFIDRYRRRRHSAPRYYGTDVYIDLVADDGTRLTLNGMDSARQGGPWMTTVDELQSYFAPRLRTRDLTRFRAQGTLTFGPLTVTRTGLRFRRLWGIGPEHVLPWPELQKADFDGVTLRLFVKGAMLPCFSADSRQLPNLFSLLALLDQHGHAAG